MTPFGNSIDPISAIQSTVSRMSEADKLAFAKETGLDITAIQIMDYDIALKYCQKHHINLNNNIWGRTYNYSTNPMKGLSLERTGENKALTKQDLYIKLADIKDPKLRDDIENILNGGKPSETFLKMLNERYEKHQAEFEAKWAEYQAAKGNKTTLKNTLTKLQNKYEGSESDYENSLVRHAENNYKNAEIDTDVLLSAALYLSHRVV